MKNTLFFLEELIVCLILGAIPLILSAYIGDQKAITTMVKALQPTKCAVFYAVVLFIFYCLVVMVRRLLLMKKLKTKSFIMFWESILSQVGNGLQGIFRISTGMFFVLPVLWFFIEKDTFYAYDTLVLTIYLWGAGMFVVCCCLSYVHNNFSDKTH